MEEIDALSYPFVNYVTKREICKNISYQISGQIHWAAKQTGFVRECCKSSSILFE